MTGRSKVLAPLATVVAVGAVAVTATLVAGGGSGSRAPRVLHLAGVGNGAARDAAPASSGSAGSGPGGGAYRLTGDLPQGKPADAAAWTLPAGPGPAAPVARLADAFKAGTPVREGNGWRAGGLHVTGDAGRAWYFYRCSPESPVASDAPLAPDSCTFSSGQGYAAPGTVGSGTASSGTVTAEPPPSGPNASPVPRPGKPVEPPAQKTPTKEQVRAAAAPILDAVGLADATAVMTAFPGGGSAVVDPAVGSLETYGWTTRVDVDQDGKLTGGNGWLATPEKADTYPLVTAREAFDNLPMPPRIMSCEVTPGGGCKEPAPTEITGAHLGLTVAQLAGGGQLLLPAWLFDVKGSPDPVAGVAVEAKYLASPDQPTAEPATGSPTQVDPAPPTATGPRSELSFDSAYRAKTPAAVIVQYGDSGSCPHKNVTHAVKEDATSVYVFLEADSTDPKTVCTEDYRAMKVEVALQAPLGTRKVIDGASGREIAVS